MAKRKKAATRSPSVKIIKAPAPIVRVSAPRAPAVRRRRRSSGGRSSKGLGVGGIISNEAVQMAVGGALYGYAVKSGLVAKLPAIPVLGRTGTAAILLDYWARHGGGQNRSGPALSGAAAGLAGNGSSTVRAGGARR